MLMESMLRSRTRVDDDNDEGDEDDGDDEEGDDNEEEN
jgi:hypothetical protein